MNELQQVIDRFSDAWNRHDVDALAEMWVEHGELNHPWGFHAVGQHAIRSLLREDHSDAMQASRVRLRIRNAELRDARGFAEIDGELEGVLTPDRHREYRLEHRMSAMFALDDGGRWRIVSLTVVANPGTGPTVKA